MRELLAKTLRWLWRLPRTLAILLVRFYQLAISPMLGSNCRFQPTCSTYFIQSVQKHGLLVGGYRGTLRIFRCNPWFPGGYDPP